MKRTVKGLVTALLAALLVLGSALSLPLVMEGEMQSTLGYSGALAETGGEPQPDDTTIAPFQTASPVPALSTPTPPPPFTLATYMPSAGMTPEESVRDPFFSTGFQQDAYNVLTARFFELQSVAGWSESDLPDGVLAAIRPHENNLPMLRLYGSLLDNLKKDAVFVPGKASLNALLDRQCLELRLDASSDARTLVRYAYRDLVAFQPFLLEDGDEHGMVISRERAAEIRQQSLDDLASEHRQQSSLVSDSVALAASFLTEILKNPPLVYDSVPFVADDSWRLLIAGCHVYCIDSVSGNEYVVTVDARSERVYCVAFGAVPVSEIENALNAVDAREEAEVVVDVNMLASGGLGGNEEAVRDAHFATNVLLDAGHYVDTIPYTVTRVVKRQELPSGGTRAAHVVHFGRADPAASALDPNAEPYYEYTVDLNEDGTLYAFSRSVAASSLHGQTFGLDFARIWEEATEVKELWDAFGEWPDSEMDYPAMKRRMSLKTAELLLGYPVDKRESKLYGIYDIVGDALSDWGVFAAYQMDISDITLNRYFLGENAPALEELLVKLEITEESGGKGCVLYDLLTERIVELYRGER